jgi:hypothetical protein
MIFLMLDPPNDGSAPLVLFLDDSEWRHREFTRVMGTREGVKVHRVYTADQAISLLGKRKYVQVFLDHDLDELDEMSQVGDRTVVPTGMKVVEHIMTMDEPPKEVVVHSCNVPAAEIMHARLDLHPGGIRVTRCPFPFLLQAMTR